MRTRTQKRPVWLDKGVREKIEEVEAGEAGRRVQARQGHAKAFCL